MSYITTIPESDASGPLAEQYERGKNPDGTVDNVLKVHSLNPDSLHAHLELYISAMHRSSPLSRAEREIVATVVSRLNGCEYCLRHHGEGLRKLLPEERRPLVEELASGDTGSFTARERAMIEYSEKLTREPSSVTESDINALRDAGLDDRAVLDLACVVGYFAYANRIVLGLGAQIEGEESLGFIPEESR